MIDANQIFKKMDAKYEELRQAEKEFKQAMEELKETK